MSSDTTRHPAEVHQHLGVKARQRRPPGVTRCSIANSDSYLDFSPFRGTPCRPGGTPHKGNSGDGREAFAADPATSRIRAIGGDSPRVSLHPAKRALRGHRRPRRQAAQRP